jgi:hypothetical protein
VAGLKAHGPGVFNELVVEVRSALRPP